MINLVVNIPTSEYLDLFPDFNVQTGQNLGCSFGNSCRFKPFIWEMWLRFLTCGFCPGPVILVVGIWGMSQWMVVYVLAVSIYFSEFSAFSNSLSHK